jgi:MFS family permease
MMAPRRWPTSWLFSLLILPLGIIVVGFNFTALPFLLAQAGVSVDRIASIGSIINLPGVVGFLFAPVVDIKLRRRTWLALGTFGTALSTCLYFPLIGASHLILMTGLILVGGLTTFLVSAACGGLMVKTLSQSAQSKAAAWIMAGQLGGGALGAAFILWLAARVSMATVPNANSVRRMAEVISEAHCESQALRRTHFSLTDGMCGSSVRKEEQVSTDIKT